VVVLRATQKILRSLPKMGAEIAVSDTALGDWYVNRLVVDRRPLLLIVSARSLLAIIEPARDLKQLPDRLPRLVKARLTRLPVNEHVVSCEVETTKVVAVDKTIDRSVLGQLVDFAKAIPCYLPEGQWGDSELRYAEDQLAETPCQCSKRDAEVIWPTRMAIRLLEAAWPSDKMRH
jgi:hypothetical protein